MIRPCRTSFDVREMSADPMPTMMSSPRARPLYSALLLATLFAFGCSGSTSDDGGLDDRDAGTRDTGAPADAGVRTECTIPENNPECQTQADCSNPRPPQVECTTCPSDTESLCLAGKCETPPRIPSNNGHVYRVSIAGFEADIVVLVGLVVTAEMVGGATITCQDALERFTWDDWRTNTCFNVLRSRYLKFTGAPGQVYTLSFSQFASGQRALFLAYGFTDEDTATAPVGVTCTEFDVGEPGTDSVAIMGENLQRIE